jgi:hypothetical protein
MPNQTPAQGFPTPALLDDPNIPEDIHNLAIAIERRVVGIYNSASDRDTAVSGPAEGQVAYLRDENKFTFYNGTSWVNMLGSQVSITSGTVVPSNSSGTDGDVFFKV